MDDLPEAIGRPFDYTGGGDKIRTARTLRIGRKNPLSQTPRLTSTAV
ncbi:MAG: hypothetical protein ACR2G4_04495 [Pyrinomonadaceae bacterium]